MANKDCEKDERAVAVEKSSQSLGFLVVLFALLIDIAYRSFVRGETAWDLFVIVVLGGLVAVAYQLRYRIWTRARTQVKMLAVAFAVGLVTAAVIALIRLLK